MMYVCLSLRSSLCFFFFFNDTATTEIYTLSLHDALPIFRALIFRVILLDDLPGVRRELTQANLRSEEHTSELQSPCNLVCRLLLEKKKESAYVPINFLPTPHQESRLPPLPDILPHSSGHT